MNILYLAHRIPYPPNKGDKIRSFNEVKFLAASHTVDLVCLADDPVDLQYKEALQKFCRKVFVCPISTTWSKIRGLAGLFAGRSISSAYFYRKRVQAILNQWLERDHYDAIVCFSSPMAEYIFQSKLLAGEGNNPNRTKLIMDFCDIDSDKWLQYSQGANLPMKQIYCAENERLQTYEEKIYRTFDSSIVASDLEKKVFLKICPQAEDVIVILNGVDAAYFSPDSIESASDLKNGPNLVFTGAMDYHANVDGVCWFCEEIFPRLNKEFPNLNFDIVGRHPAPAVKKLDTIPGVHVIGDVVDIRPWYQKADVYVVPLRLGRGVQNKVLEAMAMGRPVVATSKANSGIVAKHDEHLMLADTSDTFATTVKNLLQNDEKRKVLGRNARNFVQAEFDWNTNMAKLNDLLQ